MQVAISFLVDKDVVLKKVHQQYGNPYLPSRPEDFQTLDKTLVLEALSQNHPYKVRTGLYRFISIGN